MRLEHLVECKKVYFSNNIFARQGTRFSLIKHNFTDRADEGINSLKPYIL